MSTSASSEDDAEAEAALTLRHQLIYNGEVLDIALESIRSYKEGTQSLHTSILVFIWRGLC